MTTTTPTVETDLACWKCQYALMGLPTQGVCPECGCPIAESEQHAAQQARSRFDILPVWLRVLRTAYFTAFFTMAAAPLVLPTIADLIGLQRTRHSMFWDVYGQLGLWLAAFALAMAILLAAFKRPGQSVCVVFLWLAGAILMPAISY